MHFALSLSPLFSTLRASNALVQLRLHLSLQLCNASPVGIALVSEPGNDGINLLSQDTELRLHCHTRCRIVCSHGCSSSVSRLPRTMRTAAHGCVDTSFATTRCN